MVNATKLSLQTKLKEIANSNNCEMIMQKHHIVSFSSGSIIIDQLTNIGGYPRISIIEIFGQPSTGKTTLALHAIREMQQISKKKIIFFDLERTLNLEYAEKIGINIKNFIILRPKNAEDTFDLMIDFLKTKEVDLIVLDSVAALLPEIEKESSMVDNTIGLQARIMSKALRKINYLLSETQATIIFINQIREKIKMFFGNPETTTGGNALKFYASLRIELRRKNKILKNKEVSGICVSVNIVKNKLAQPFKKGLITINFGKGICKFEEILILGLAKNLITQKGNWFFFDGFKIGMGKTNAIQFLIQNQKTTNKIEKKIRK